MAIEHMFVCPNVPERPPGISVASLWSEEIKVLRSTLKFCRQFAPDGVSPSVVESDEDVPLVAGSPVDSFPSPMSADAAS